ncbi:hypothetical protein ACIA5C_44860 [Actinoplanes sp. NPDC051343]|uniref:hypothetical protein n=1 Tax=Actinoplanes sp. NPDC051343 TaxID=3363906 RepID=UPI0037B6D187
MRDRHDRATAACAGFLWRNTSPARILMGDLGSLGFGGLIGGLARAPPNAPRPPGTEPGQPVERPERERHTARDTGSAPGGHILEPDEFADPGEDRQERQRRGGDRGNRGRHEVVPLVRIT